MIIIMTEALCPGMTERGNGGISISPNGNFAHIDFDAATGELLLAEEEVEYNNGDVEWKSFN